MFLFFSAKFCRFGRDNVRSTKMNRCVATAIMVTPTRQSVVLYIHCTLLICQVPPHPACMPSGYSNYWLLITNCVHRSHFWEPIISHVVDKFPHVSWNPKFHYSVHNRPSLAPIVSQINPVHALQFYLLKPHFDIIIPTVQVGNPVFRIAIRHRMGRLVTTTVLRETIKWMPYTLKYRIIKNDCRGFNNLSYTIHLR